MEKKHQAPQWLSALLFPAALLYYEVLFRVSTVQNLFQLGSVYMLLFCIVYGGCFYLLACLSGRKLVNYLITLLYLIMSAVPFLVQYFVYRQFKLFYDIATMLGGASDMLSDYASETVMLVFSWSGIGKILLFFLPAILFAVFGWRFLTAGKLRLRSWLATAASLVVVFCLSLFGICQSSNLSLVYDEEYNYQNAVSSFGLLTGLRLDIREYLSDDGGGSFESVGTIPTLPTPSTVPATQPEPTEPEGTTVPEETEPVVTEPPVVYVPNALDIDFASLEAKGTIAELNAYVSTLTPSMTNEYTGLFEGKNLIFITAEALTAEVIDPELTPTLYRLATKGIQFTDYYQPSSAGTTGGEYQNVFGMLPTKAGVSFKRTQDDLNYFTMGSQLNRLGYYGKAFHNNSYTYYDRHKTHINLGYSDGFMGYGNGMEEYVSKQWPQSDLEMFMGTLPTYIDKQPFNVYYMTVSGHSGYSRAGNCMTDKNWDRVKDLDYSSTVRGYLAANLELEDALTYLVSELEAAGIADNTVICISADHFPYGLDNDAYLGNMPYLSELYGYNVTTEFQRDHNRLILWSGCLEDMDPIVVDTPTSSLDILPTLSNLFGTRYDSRLMVGRDVFSDQPALVFNTSYHWKTEYGTYTGGRFRPADDSIEVTQEYIDAIKTIVRNKIRYCEGVLDTDYFRYLYDQGQLP